MGIIYSVKEEKIAMGNAFSNASSNGVNTSIGLNSRNSNKNLSSVNVVEPPTAPTTMIQMPNNSNKNKNKNSNTGINVVVKENKKNQGVVINVKPVNTESVNGTQSMTPNQMVGGRKTRKSKKNRSRSRKH